jgi:aspartate-semialdehyde dehydrogenase
VQNIAVLGANTLVGSELVNILEQREFPANEVYFYDTNVRKDEKVVFKGKGLNVCSSYEEFLDDVDLIFCCLNRIQARALVSKCKKKALVIDCSGAFRFAPHVQHVIPEINGHVLSDHEGIVANPHPTTIQLLVALNPLHGKFKLKRLHITALNAVSDLGQDALDELNYEFEFLAVGEKVEKAEGGVFPYTIGNNLIPQVGDFVGKGYTEEENLLAREITSILGGEDIPIAATFVWVPVQRADCVVVHADFEDKATVDKAKKTLRDASGVRLMDHDDEYPTPESVVGTDDVFVGRIREDTVFENGLTMWMTVDNLRKGSALNAVQIAEQLQDNF